MKNYEIKITGSGTQEEIAEALRSVANHILSAGAGNPNLATNELDDAEWEDSTLATKISIQEEESLPDYILRDAGILVVGSNFVRLNEKIRDEELHEYSIIDREDIMEDLMRWIGEGSASKELMKIDLEMLMGWDDDYIFSSNSTNSYISSSCPDFNKVCEELIEIHESL